MYVCIFTESKNRKIYLCLFILYISILINFKVIYILLFLTLCRKNSAFLLRCIEYRYIEYFWKIILSYIKKFLWHYIIYYILCMQLRIFILIVSFSHICYYIVLYDTEKIAVSNTTYMHGCNVYCMIFTAYFIKM